jgi:predicted DNA-binding transcriptional regulator AlpA
MTTAKEYAPRGINREDAARYIGVSPRKFDELVADGRMPKPRRVDGRVIWDRVALDVYFDALPTEKDTLQGLIEASRMAANK